MSLVLLAKINNVHNYSSFSLLDYNRLMTTYYICRHGKTENNKNRRLSGWIDAPLTEEGVKHAVSASKKLNGLTFDAVIASDLGRAFVTAYIITQQLGITDEILRNNGLREMNYGDLANVPYDAYPVLTPEENAVFVSPNGESLNFMQQRVMNTIAKLSLAYEGKTALLVAHDGTINAIRASFSGENMGIADLTNNAHDSVTKFEYTDRVVSFDTF